ncbi:MAG: EAL domain-containing protein [Propionivibrio sp.]
MDDWDARRAGIVGLGERSFRKSYYPQLRQNLERLERFHTLLDQTADFVVLVALPDGTVTDANAALGRLLGAPAPALIGRPFAELGLGDAQGVLDVLRQEMGDCVAGSQTPGHSVVVEFSPPDHSGDSLWLDFSYRVAVVDGRPYGVMVGRDITERRRNHLTMSALLAEKEALLENALVGIIMVRQRQIVSCNRRFDAIFGYPSAALIGQSTRALFETEEAFQAFGTEAYRRLSNGEAFTATLMMVRADGGKFWCELTGSAVDPGAPRERSIWILTDVTERRQAEERARFLSYHDALTGLPNQLLLQDRLQQAIAFSNRMGTKLALMVLDIDRFKAINDFLGHDAGNRLLVAVAERLKHKLRGTDTVCRQGGDEYLLLLTNLAEPDAVVTFLGELQDSLREPFHIGETEMAISVSVGVTMYPEDGTDLGTLLRKADMAMYRAKDAGRNSYRFFNEEMNDAVIEQVTLHSGLRRGLEAGQFALYYQPQIEVSTGRLVGAEALIRWNHPDLGLVSPARFIPVAEETGLIVEIGDWVLREACREVARWIGLGLPEPRVAVNLSALQFKRGDIEKSVASALEASGIEPAMLELELTESILISDVENILSIVKRLKMMGVRLSIDDFGTGYSSLSYLKRFEVDKLKIDQSFIRDLATDPEDAAIVRAIIQMARSLGLQTVAEGVESQDVLDHLQRFQCDETQGYLHARPLPADDFVAFFQAQRHAAPNP